MHGLDYVGFQTTCCLGKPETLEEFMVLYPYVGHAHALERTKDEAPAAALHTLDMLWDVLQELEASGIQSGEDLCTYVVDRDGFLRVTQRRREHVVCAGGGPVQAAGEIRFDVENSEVVEVSNLSTGFCPDATSWDAVEAALHHLGLRHPDGFTAEFVFRMCTSCQQRNVVRDTWFYCAMCDAELDSDYNFPTM